MRSHPAAEREVAHFARIGEAMFWLLLVVSVQADFSGTWKVREPAIFESAFETCRFRGVVAHVNQSGNDVTGSYEGLVSCSDPHWPEDEWRKRVGTLAGTVEGDAISITIDDAILELQGTLDGNVISGSVTGADATAWRWSAGRVLH